MQYVAYESKPEVGAIEAGWNAVNHENEAGMPAHSVGYESVNGSAGELGSYQSSGAIENGVPSKETDAPVAEQHVEDGRLIFFCEISKCQLVLVFFVRCLFSHLFSFYLYVSRTLESFYCFVCQNYVDNLFVKILCLFFI